MANKTSLNGIMLIQSFESFRSKSYLCPAGVWTIGYGSTRWLDGRKVIENEVITIGEATYLLDHDLKMFEECVNDLLTAQVNQNQYDSIISFTYNVGCRNLNVSTLLKKINADPNDPSITDEFLKWIYADRKKLEGLIRRRKAEALLYFKK